MTKTEKMTNSKALAFVLANCEVPADVAEKLTAMKAQIDKKSSAERKPTANQVANEGIKEEILEVLSDVGMTVSEIQKSTSALAELSNQRISSLLRQLIESHKVVRSEVKGKAFFSLA